MASSVLPETTRAIYPFESHFLALSDGHRLHYVDDGPREGEVLLFLHGYPTWSFAFRALIVYYAALGLRCIAPDYVGYGLSDKPTSRRYHTMARHTTNLIELIDHLELVDVTLVCEDWGAPLGLGWALRYPEKIKRLVIMNAWAFQDTLVNRLHPLIRLATRPGLGEFLFGTLNLAFSLGLQRWTQRTLSSTVMASYRLPFREARQRAALVQFPRMINSTENHPSAGPMRAIEQGLPSLRGIPTLIIWGQEDPLLPQDVAQHWKSLIPRAKGPRLIPDAGHLLAEDAPDLVIEHLDAFLGDAVSQ